MSATNNTNIRPIGDKMCPSPVNVDEKKPEKKEGETNSASGGSLPASYSHIFKDMDTEQNVHRGMLMHRLVHDPFYKAMNVTDPARMWMLRHLTHVLENTGNLYKLNLLQYSLFLGRDYMLNFMKYKNAPPEMYPVLDEIFAPSSKYSDYAYEKDDQGASSKKDQ